MGCIDSKHPKSKDNSEAIELEAKQSISPPPRSSKVSGSPSQALSPKQKILMAKKADEEIRNPAHDVMRDDCGDEIPPPAAEAAPPSPIATETTTTNVPPPSEVTHSPVAGEKKLKMSEILQAERLKKSISATSGQYTGEVCLIEYSYLN